MGMFDPLADIENAGRKLARLLRRDPRDLGVERGEYRPDDAERTGAEIHHVAVTIHERLGIVVDVFGRAGMRDDIGVLVGGRRLDLGGETIVEPKLSLVLIDGAG